jgi:hypothetical protein
MEPTTIPTSVPVNVPASEVHWYLTPLVSRGEGRVRESGLASTGHVWEDTPDGRRLVVSFTHPTLGRYDIRLYDVYDEYLDDDQLARLLERATWSVLDSKARSFGTLRPADARNWRWPEGDDLDTANEVLFAELGADPSAVVYAAAGGVFGSSQARAVTTRLEVVRFEVDTAPGACRACGSTDFRLSARIGFDVSSPGDGRFVPKATSLAELAETAVLSNVFMALTCKGCGTDHPAVHGSRLDGVLSGVKFSSSGVGSGRVTFADLASGGLQERDLLDVPDPG